MFTYSTHDTTFTVWPPIDGKDPFIDYIDSITMVNERLVEKRNIGLALEHPGQDVRHQRQLPMYNCIYIHFLES